MGNMSDYIEDLDKLKHMLGMNYPKKSWGFRNYYTVCIGSEGEKSMNRLLKKGLVYNTIQTTESIIYHATEEGCALAGLNKKQTKRALNFWK